MSKRVSRIAGAVMLLIAITFFIFALNNPQGSFPWSNTVTYSIYGVYAAIMLVLIIAPFKSKHCGNNLHNHANYQKENEVEQDKSD